MGSGRCITLSSYHEETDTGASWVHFLERALPKASHSGNEIVIGSRFSRELQERAGEDESRFGGLSRQAKTQKAISWNSS